MINHSVLGHPNFFRQINCCADYYFFFFLGVGGGDIKKPNSKVEAVEAPKLGCFHRFWGSSWVLSLSPGEDQRGTMLEKKTWMCLKKEYTTGNHFPKNGPKLRGIPPIGCHQPKVGETMRDTWPFQWKMMIDHKLDHQLRGARLVEINHDKPQK